MTPGPDRPAPPDAAERLDTPCVTIDLDRLAREHRPRAAPRRRRRPRQPPAYQDPQDPGDRRDADRRRRRRHHLPEGQRGRGLRRRRRRHPHQLQHRRRPQGRPPDRPRRLRPAPERGRRQRNRARRPLGRRPPPRADAAGARRMRHRLRPQRRADPGRRAGARPPRRPAARPALRRPDGLPQHRAPDAAVLHRGAAALRGGRRPGRGALRRRHPGAAQPRRLPDDDRAPRRHLRLQRRDDDVLGRRHPRRLRPARPRHRRQPPDRGPGDHRRRLEDPDARAVLCRELRPGGRIPRRRGRQPLRGAWHDRPRRQRRPPEGGRGRAHRSEPLLRGVEHGRRGLRPPRRRRRAGLAGRRARLREPRDASGDRLVPPAGVRGGAAAPPSTASARSGRGRPARRTRSAPRAVAARWRATDCVRPAACALARPADEPARRSAAPPVRNDRALRSLRRSRSASPRPDLARSGASPAPG